MSRNRMKQSSTRKDLRLRIKFCKNILIMEVTFGDFSTLTSASVLCCSDAYWAMRLTCTETLAMKGLTLNCMDKKTEAYELVRKGLKVGSRIFCSEKLGSEINVGLGIWAKFSAFYRLTLYVVVFAGVLCRRIWRVMCVGMSMDSCTAQTGITERLSNVTETHSDMIQRIFKFSGTCRYSRCDVLPSDQVVGALFSWQRLVVWICTLALG